MFRAAGDPFAAHPLPCVKLFNKDGRFFLGIILSNRTIIPATRFYKLPKAVKHKGKSCRWCVESWECDVNKRPLRRTAILGYAPTESEGKQLFEKIRARKDADAKAAVNRTTVSFDRYQVSANNAQWKVLSRAFPRTFKHKDKMRFAIENGTSLTLQQRAKIERDAVLAFNVESRKLGIPTMLDASDPDALEIIAEATANRFKTNTHPIDYELAGNWILKGYYTQTFNSIGASVAQKFPKLEGRDRARPSNLGNFCCSNGRLDQRWVLGYQLNEGENIARGT